MPAGASSNVNDTGSSSVGTSLAVMELHVVEGLVLYDVGVQGGVGIRLLSINCACGIVLVNSLFP